MKIAENQLRNLKKVSKRVNANISLKMVEKLKSKGLISGRLGFLSVTEKGQKEIKKRFGDDFYEEGGEKFVDILPEGTKANNRQ
ncbi:MAG: hypothetical protein WC608_04545 [Parcubacteria group bacterium]